METLLTLLILIATHDDKYTTIRKDESAIQREMDMVYRPNDSQHQTNKATVSYYDKSACGSREYGKTCKTANGEIFDENGFTFAHRTIKFGTRVTFGYNNKSVTCRANDRGPFIYSREFDLSLGCFSALSGTNKGIINVEYEQTN